MSCTNSVTALMERAPGRVSIVAPDGATRIFNDLAKAGAFADSIADPWLDLVTEGGFAVGVFVPGKPDALSPEPSVWTADGGIYLFDGDAVPDMPRGVHCLPLADLDKALAPGTTIDDLYWYLPQDVDVQTEATRRQITLMSGSRRDEKQGKWKPLTSTFDQFQTILRQHAVGQKDGPCFLQGESAGGARKAVAMVRNCILGVDLDSGAPLEQVMDAIRSRGLQAIIYTTHSHMKDVSVIKRDHFMKWCDGEDATEALVRDYLIRTKGILPQIVENCTIIDDAKHTDEGVVIVVQHNPMPKFRAIFSLKEDFVFARRGGAQQDAILEWKELYAGFCSELGLYFDEKCVDPARLFYLPRHPKGATGHGAWVIYGDPLDLDTFPRVKMKRGRDGKRRAVGGNAFSDAAGGADDEDDAERYLIDGMNLRAWASKQASRFEIQTCLEDNAGGDVIRDERSGKAGVHIECPFEAEHSSFGGQGTFVVNASDNYDEGNDSGFSIVCVHNACSARDRLDFLKGMITEGWIEPKDLTDKNYLLAIEGDADDEQSAPATKPNQTLQPQTDKEREKAETRDATDLAYDNDFGTTEDSMLKAFNRRYAVIRTGSGVRVLVEPRTESEDVVFESQNDVTLYEKNRILWVKQGDSSRKIEAFKTWLEWEGRRTYSAVVFAPGQTTAKSVYNLFRGWGCDPVKPVWKVANENADTPVPGDWSMLRAHLFDNICEGDNTLFQWTMTWLSHIFQHPSAKPGSTLVVIGDKGTGKSTLFDYINRLLGRCGITVSQRKQIVGNFNGHLATTLLMVCEEAFWAADPQAEGVLKDLITNKSVLIERKGYDPIQSMNYTRLALVSNSAWVVPASLKDERRFGVLRCSNARQGDIAFFDKLRHQMDDLGGMEALLWDLLHWQPIGGSFANLFTPPPTRHLQQQQIETLGGIHKFMLELVKAGVYETHDDKVTPIELNLDEETRIYGVDIRAAVEDYVKYRFASDKAKASYDEIGAIVTEWFGAREILMRVDGQSNRKRTFVFPPLSEARAKLKETKGLDIVGMSEEDVRSIRVRNRINA